ncbi:MAG: PspC domain-containing protein [Cyclobacteriaceae bacterium]
MKKIQKFFEQQTFGVCTRLGDKLNIPIASIRIFFIYSSFITFGSPIILYMGLVWIMNIRQHMRRRNNSLWYS